MNRLQVAYNALAHFCAGNDCVLITHSISGEQVVVDVYLDFEDTVRAAIRVFKEADSDRFRDVWTKNGNETAFQPDYPTAEELGYEPGVIYIRAMQSGVTRITFNRIAR